MDLFEDRPCDLKRHVDRTANGGEQCQYVIPSHEASPLSRLRPGEQNNKFSQPPEACRRKLDHLYAISTSSPPLGGVFIVAYFCRQKQALTIISRAIQRKARTAACFAVRAFVCCK